MTFPRASGVLLHPTSIPSPYRIGDLGPAAHGFLRRLAEAKQSVWQILPLGPTSYGNSPYQSLSAFALSPLLVSPELLLEEGLVARDDLALLAPSSGSRVDYAAVVPERAGLLRRALALHRDGAGADPAARRDRFEAFREASAEWLPELARFTAIKESRGGAAWTEWPRDLAMREPSAIERVDRDLRDEVELAAFAQFLAEEHWRRVRSRAAEHGVSILGDVPIFVAHDSADVWAHREIFDLDHDGRPRVVAGVPPDYFSETGQLWGNPLFRWETAAARVSTWWSQRMRRAFSLHDRVRIDHFRGFEAYWEVPARETTAIGGRWVKGPGRAPFDAIAAALGTAVGELAVIAEDLGEITPEVHALRDELGFPGIRVLQFGFGAEPRLEIHAPHNFARNCVAYTGTHDNDTTVGWFRGGPEERRTDSAERVADERARVLRYLGTDGRQIHIDMIRVLAQSVADTAIVPMQDVLGLGSEARMNVPGRAGGNWEWKLDAKDAERVEASLASLAQITDATGRAPDPASPPATPGVGPKAPPESSPTRDPRPD
jgi:4-alpha-glucanotransferase